jgi:hypothetical protein
MARGGFRHLVVVEDGEVDRLTALLGQLDQERLRPAAEQPGGGVAEGQQGGAEGVAPILLLPDVSA